MTPAIPDASAWVYASTIEGTLAELRAQRRGPEPANWSVAHGLDRDGEPQIIATNLLEGVPTGRREHLAALFDLHPRLSAWTLMHRWRAEELGSGAVRALAEWNLMNAAALARSLLEGAMVFVLDAQTLRSAWASMKAAGPPTRGEEVAFREPLDSALETAQIGSRLDGAHISRQSILTLIQKGAKPAGVDRSTLEGVYGWLSDAVHPSFGFQAAYVVRGEPHPSGTQSVFEIGRGLDALPTARGRALAGKPAVAMAAAEALIIACRAFVEAWPSVVAVIDDYGLTTGVSRHSTLRYWRQHAVSDRNGACPCESGAKAKACVHAWGVGHPVPSSRSNP